MASLANISVNKADGSTSISYTGVVPSGGESQPAVWKSLTVGTSPAHQPELRLTARESANGTKRHLRVTYAYQSLMTDSTTSLTTVRLVNRASVDMEVFKDTPQVDIDELVHQFSGLIASATFRTYLKSLYSAT